MRELGIEDSFSFRCRACGSCCRDDREILLSPIDVFNLTRGLGLDTSSFIDTYCRAELDSGLGSFPLLSLKTPDGSCTFLDGGGLCEVHEFRPACCRNYPLGETYGRGGEVRHFLMPPAPGCLGFDEGYAHTIPGWREEAGLRALEAGAEIMRTAFMRHSHPPGCGPLKLALFKTLYDFDPLPAPDEDAQSPVDANAAMRIIARRLDALKF